jgi:serine phosphatase RsbU (regulator of sigma subunit)
LLPQEQPPVPQRYILAARKHSGTAHVSGDFYQYTLPDGKLGVAAGEVSGKGNARRAALIS